MEAFVSAQVSTASEVLGFHLHPDVMVVVAVLGFGYWYGLRRLTPTHAPQGEPAVTARQQWLFYTGLAVLFAVTSWPIHDIGERSLFTFHMIEHMAISLVVPPLFLLGTPWWFLRILVRPFLGALRFLTKPLVALVLFNGSLAILHWSVVVEGDGYFEPVPPHCSYRTVRVRPADVVAGHRADPRPPKTAPVAAHGVPLLTVTRSPRCPPRSSPSPKARSTRYMRSFRGCGG